MLVACWSAKGGAGTTVIAASLALLWSRRCDALLVDLAGDAPAALGVPEPDSPGLVGWLAAGPDVPTDALGRLEVPATADLRLLTRGARRARRTNVATCSPRCWRPTPGPPSPTAVPTPTASRWRSRPLPVARSS